MKSLRDYLAEEEFAVSNPVPGDHFDIEVNTDTLIETVVVGLTEDGDIIIDLDEAAFSLLEDVAAVDSADPADGHMSPIFGSAFLNYNRKQDPRKWFRKNKEHDDDDEHVEQHNRVTMAGAPDSATKMEEAKYQGRSVPLGKPMQGDVKKSKVYVRKPNGNIVKVNFGDKTMKIKKSNPNRRKSFRARHHCENPGPRWKVRYWSCRAW